VIFIGQDALEQAAKKAGYIKVFEYDDMIYEFEHPLEYELPEGFRFVDPMQCDVAKCTECCWKGFNHEAEDGPWDGNVVDT